MSVNPSLRKSKQEIAATVLFWISLFLMLGMPLWLFSHFFAEAQHQHHVISTYQPVQAKVLSSQVKPWEGSHHEIHYDADIKYQYDVNGTVFQSDRLAPLITWGSQEWADSMVQRYKVGERCDAFYNPDNPAEAVLLRGYTFDPYKDMLDGAFIFTGGSFFVLYLWFAKKPKLIPAENHWFTIVAESGERQRLFTAKVCTTVWYLIGAIPTAHYFLCVPPPHSARAWTDFEIFYALGLVPMLFLIRYWWMNRNMDEARLLIEQPQGFLGKSLHFSFSQTVRRQLQLKNVSLRLVCLGIKRQGKSSTSTEIFETTMGKSSHQMLHVGEDLAFSGEITPPANQPPTGRDRSGKFDWIVWKIKFDCDLLHAPDYSTEYRLEVKALPVKQPEPLVKPAGSVDVRAIEPQFAGRILSKSNWSKGFLLTLIPNVIQLSGAGLMASVFFALFPDKNGPNPCWHLPKPQAQEVFGIGVALAAIGTVWGLAFSGRLGNGYIRAVAKREIKRRPDAIVQPDANALFVEIIPRENWNRMKVKNASDIGFLTVDAPQREIRFEGDKERYRIPADALLSCDVEKSVFTSSAKPTAPGYFMVVLRAQTASGIWEAPVSPSVSKSIFNSKSRLQAAEALQAKIKALHPATVIAESDRRAKVSTQAEV